MARAFYRKNREQAQLPRLTANSMLVFVMAAACGIAVANLYYAQPLLDTLAAKFGVSPGEAGLIVTMTQLGYFLGLALLVPLGDRLERRRLICLVSLATVATLMVAAISPDIAVFLIASLAIGFTAVVAQILVPFAAHMAEEEQRGRVVGRVMAGLLIGVLLARTFSGLIAEALGWRAVFWLAAALMFVQATVLYLMLPRHRNETRLSYPALLGSVLLLFREEPLLRRRSVYGTMGFAAFSVLWTALAFLLARPPYGYGEAAIGLFGLLGAAGAFCAVLAGRLHDRGWTHAGTGTFLALIVAAFAVMGVFSTQLAAIVIGVVLLDLGQQGAHILNQSVIYQLRPEARSRLTTAYMSCFFLGGVVGSAATGYIYKFAGWTGVAWLGGTFGGIAFLFWLTEIPGRRARMHNAFR